MKSLACWIGRHKWERCTDHGDEFKVCAVCGKFKAPPSSGPKGPAVVDLPNAAGMQGTGGG